ncbi:hypothetical protein [Citrobacter sp.]|uniref:hypothetical protein n=1 Tax=Citrobacter sp. TaxID=1896336 RepID=UPI002FC9AFC7
MNNFEAVVAVLLVIIAFQTFVCWSINRSFKIMAQRNLHNLKLLGGAQSRIARLEAEITLYQSGATKEEVARHFQIQAEMNAANMDYSHNGGVN